MVRKSAPAVILRPSLRCCLHSVCTRYLCTPTGLPGSRHWRYQRERKHVHLMRIRCNLPHVLRLVSLLIKKRGLVSLTASGRQSLTILSSWQIGHRIGRSKQAVLTQPSLSEWRSFSMLSRTVSRTLKPPKSQSFECRPQWLTVPL